MSKLFNIVAMGLFALIWTPPQMGGAFAMDVMPDCAHCPDIGGGAPSMTDGVTRQHGVGCGLVAVPPNTGALLAPVAQRMAFDLSCGAGGTDRVPVPMTPLPRG